MLRFHPDRSSNQRHALGDLVAEGVNVHGGHRERNEALSSLLDAELAGLFGGIRRHHAATDETDILGAGRLRP